MHRRDEDRLVTYQFESLVVEGLVHAVFTRLGGVSRGPFAALNVSQNVGDDPAAVAENRARIYAHLGLSAGQVASTGQVHGNHVAVVTAADGGRLFPNTDGLVTGEAGVALLLRFADCQPILLYDPVHHALGLVHAGWRGVAQGIALRAVETMQTVFATQPPELLAGLGPAIGPCCYTVGQEVASAMGYALPDWRGAMRPLGEELWRLDLSAANIQLLRSAGVRRIEPSGLCTACRKDEFFSHRGEQGRTGRFAVVAYLQPRVGALRDGVAGEPPDQGRGDELTRFDSLHPPGMPAFGEQVEGET